MGSNQMTRGAALASRMRPLVLLFVGVVLLTASSAGYRDEPADTEYYVMNAAFETFLYVEPRAQPPAPGQSNTQLTCNVLATKLLRLLPLGQATFYVRVNNALGPFFNIVNVGLNATLFASELTLSRVQDMDDVHTVLAWKDTLHLNTPEATWNIRLFQGNVYILNEALGGYLYVGNETSGPTALPNGQHIPTLLPSEEGGRGVRGAQWRVLRADEFQGRRGSQGTAAPDLDLDLDALAEAQAGQSTLLEDLEESKQGADGELKEKLDDDEKKKAKEALDLTTPDLAALVEAQVNESTLVEDLEESKQGEEEELNVKQVEKETKEVLKRLEEDEKRDEEEEEAASDGGN